MQDRESFERNIAAAPGNHNLRLVYADWLDEQGDGDAAFQQRLMATVRNLRQVNTDKTVTDEAMKPLLDLYDTRATTSPCSVCGGQKVVEGTQPCRRCGGSGRCHIAGGVSDACPDCYGQVECYGGTFRSSGRNAVACQACTGTGQVKNEWAERAELLRISTWLVANQPPPVGFKGCTACDSGAAVDLCEYHVAVARHRELLPRVKEHILAPITSLTKVEWVNDWRCSMDDVLRDTWFSRGVLVTILGPSAVLLRLNGVVDILEAREPLLRGTTLQGMPDMREAWNKTGRSPSKHRRTRILGRKWHRVDAIGGPFYSDQDRSADTKRAAALLAVEFPFLQVSVQHLIFDPE